MPKQSSKSSGKRQKRDDDDDSDGSDDDIQPIHFFVPGENINVAVLVEYINLYVDRTAKITSAQHPTDKTRTGFNVSAKRALNAVSIRDLINDSKDWDTETQSREYRKNPYNYRESDTAKRRARKGPTEGGTNRPQQPRGKREGAAEPQEVAPRQERATIQSSSGGGGPQPQYQTQYTQYASHSQPHMQTSSHGYNQPMRPESSGPVNPHANVPASFAPSRAGQPVQYVTANYTPGGHTPSFPQEADPPPAYQPSVSAGRGGGGPQPPAQPGPDTFDALEKPATSRSQSYQDRRPSTYDQSSSRRSGR